MNEIKPEWKHQFTLTFTLNKRCLVVSFGHHSVFASRHYTSVVDSLNSIQLKIISDEDSQYCGNVVDRCEVKRWFVVIFRVPDLREWIADQMDYRHSCMHNQMSLAYTFWTSVASDGQIQIRIWFKSWLNHT